MTDLEDGDGEVMVLNLVQDAVLSLPDPKQIVARELLAARRYNVNAVQPNRSLGFASGGPVSASAGWRSRQGCALTGCCGVMVPFGLCRARIEPAVFVFGRLRQGAGPACRRAAPGRCALVR
jgi:hypothetical protein